MPPDDTTTRPALHVEDLGRLGYGPALDRQYAVHAAVLAGEAPPTVLLVEHDPVITLTRKKGVADHLTATPAQLAAAGVATHETDRGGDITYHGPGQLVAYPILTLADYGLNLSRYMRLLEQTVIDTAAASAITAHREKGATGVWVDPGSDRPTEKLCALGVRIRKNTTLHGLALNVTTNLDHFKLIVPCGLHGRPVTSLRAILGDDCPSMGEVKQELVTRFNDNLAATRGA